MKPSEHTPEKQPLLQSAVDGSIWDRQAMAAAASPSAPPLYPYVPPQGYPVISPGAPAMGTPVPAMYPSPYPGPQISPSHLPAPPTPPPAVQAPEAVVVVCRHDTCHAPDHITCGKCGRLVVPYACKEAGACSWFAAAGLCVLGCWACAWVPFCLDSTKDTVFHCPRCRSELYRLQKP